MRRAALLMAALCGAACSDDKGHVSPSLRQALVSAREALAELCGTVDGCYPGFVMENEDWCTVPQPRQGSLSFERGWPKEEADECWQPLYEQNPKLVLDYFACLSAKDRVATRCFDSCPGAEDSEACMRASHDAEVQCATDLWGVVSDSDALQVDRCQEQRER